MTRLLRKTDILCRANTNIDKPQTAPSKNENGNDRRYTILMPLQGSSREEQARHQHATIGTRDACNAAHVGSVRERGCGVRAPASALVHHPHAKCSFRRIYGQLPTLSGAARSHHPRTTSCHTDWLTSTRIIPPQHSSSLACHPFSWGRHGCLTPPSSPSVSNRRRRSRQKFSSMAVLKNQVQGTRQQSKDCWWWELMVQRKQNP